MKPRTAQLTQFFIILVIAGVPFASGPGTAPFEQKAVMAAAAALALVLVAMRWNERGPDGRREPALRWPHALFFAAAGGAMWLAFAAETMMARAGAVLAVGMSLLAAVDFLRVRRAR